MLAWLPEAVEQFSLLDAPRVALASLLNQGTALLAQSNRLTSRDDFLRVTKSPIRSSTKALVGYLLTDNTITAPKVGFIVPRAVGGSVTRHKVTRQLRHASRAALNHLPPSSLVVVRAIKKDQNANTEIPALFDSLTKKAAR